MSKGIALVIIAIIALYYFQPSIFAGITDNIPFLSGNTQNNTNQTYYTSNTTTTNLQSIATTESTTTTQPGDIGKPTNNYGQFNCQYDSDCTIYLECTDCKCRTTDGICYNTTIVGG